MFDPSAASVKILAFDVFGTVVDWRSSVISEAEQIGRSKGLSIDGPAFAMPGAQLIDRHWTACGQASCLGPNLTLFIVCL